MKRHMWTKDEIRTVVTLWESNTVESICEAMNITSFQLHYIAKKLRDNGIKLTRKRKRSNVDLIIKELVDKLKKETN